MEATAAAPGAGTVLNALATGRGSAFAIDETVEATVELTPGEPPADGPDVTGTVADAPDADTELIETCVANVLSHHGPPVERANVRTTSEIPMAGGLKSSSAAANATVLATFAALGDPDALDRADMARIGVDAARTAGVTATGAFDDASASMLGGLTLTDNTEDALLARETVDWDVLVWTPPTTAYSADADVARCEQVAPVADHVEALVREGRYGLAMTLNGLAFCGALDFSPAPMVEAMDAVEGVSLSGTGPSVVAVGDRANLETVRDRWTEYDGETLLTTTRTDGAVVR